ncbi:MAG TPA: hypothetical protein PKW21_11510 [Rhabdaerophilum sp.]|nr:hypothetical protein [Rhabdaerophilum sp.]
MQNKRTEPRNPSFLRAEIILGTNLPPVPAEVHDISDRGMRLVVEKPEALPAEFMVSIPRRRLREFVEVVRREEGSLGVRVQPLKRIAIV